MEMAVGHHAATRQSYRDESSMKELLTRLRDEYPQAGLDEIVRRFVERARVEDEYLNACVEHSVVNTWNTMERTLRQSITRPAPHVTQAAAQERAEKVTSLVQKIMYLNLPQMNGKLLRYCTREEVAKFGGAYARLVKKMKRGQTVEQAFNEAQVRSIMK